MLSPPRSRLSEAFSIRTKSLSLDFQVGDDGRLYQQPVGAKKTTLKRDDEAYPQAGDGYIWGLPSKSSTPMAILPPHCSMTASLGDVDGGRQLTQIKLHDPAYPVEVTLNFQTDPERDVIEQWTTVTPHESGGITLEHMAQRLDGSRYRSLSHAFLRQLGV